jgi:hypothetical protein
VQLPGICHGLFAGWCGIEAVTRALGTKTASLIFWILLSRGLLEIALEVETVHVFSGTGRSGMERCKCESLKQLEAVVLGMGHGALEMTRDAAAAS